jgi:hypothetical protein
MKTFSQLKASFLPEASKVKPLVGKSKEDLEKLHYSKFPLESDPELKELGFKDRMTIMSAKDKVFAASKDLIAKDKSKVGRALFKKTGAAVGDYTTLGLVSKITKDGVVFNTGNEIPYSMKSATGISMFDGIKKISKGTYTKKMNTQKSARDSGMEDFAKRFRLD